METRTPDLDPSALAMFATTAIILLILMNSMNELIVHIFVMQTSMLRSISCVVEKFATSLENNLTYNFPLSNDKTGEEIP